MFLVLGIRSSVGVLALPFRQTNNNEKFRSFKSKENIHKKEVGSNRSNHHVTVESDFRFNLYSPKCMFLV